MEFLVEIVAELFIALDGLTILADLYAWMRGKDNRRERKEARRHGLPPPPRDGWNTAVIMLSLIAAGLTAYLVWGLR